MTGLLAVGRLGTKWRFPNVHAKSLAQKPIVLVTAAHAIGPTAELLLGTLRYPGASSGASKATSLIVFEMDLQF